MTTWPIARALPSHAGAMARLAAAALDATWNEHAFAKLLDDPTTVACVALGPADALLGAAVGRAVADEAELLLLAVAANVRRRGVGLALLNGIIATVRNRGSAGRLYLEVAASNTPARALYESAGFVEIGRRKDYYVQPGSAPADAIVLSLAIPNNAAGA